MQPTCDCCSNLAVVHETIVVEGRRSEVHLCAEHAAERGYLLQGDGDSLLPAGLPLSKLLKKSAADPAAPAVSSTSARTPKACSSCGMTMASLRETQLVGCAECYRALEEELAILIGRTQEGATTHAGRHPMHAAKLIDRAAVRNRLTRDLREAVSREEFERAARIRDEMLALSDPSEAQ